MASSAEFQELKTLILGVDKKVGDFSEKLDNVEHSLKTMVNEESKSTGFTGKMRFHYITAFKTASNSYIFQLFMLSYSL
jgi:hypothetical protein